MITTDVLDTPPTIAEQLDALVVETFGAVRLVMPETGMCSKAMLAAAAWCHTFARQHDGAELLRVLPNDTNDGLQLRCESRDASYDSLMQHRSGDPALLNSIAQADVLIVGGLSEISPSMALVLLRTVIHRARPATLVVAPVSSASSLLQPLSTAGAAVTFATDELISTDALQVQRAALIAASAMHRTHARNGDT